MAQNNTIIVTGGAGFIGSAVIRQYMAQTDIRIINIDKLTYAGNQSSLNGIKDHPNYIFEKQDICDNRAMVNIFTTYQPDAIIHLAAESHVDRSIDSPSSFIKTNIFGTYILLESALTYWEKLRSDKKKRFRFLHISTDEVFGSLGEKGLFSENSAYNPSSPYSASKASSDHLVRAWFHTHGLPVLITNCSNNYGPYQFPEKLIPLTILNALDEKPLTVYGKGNNIRDWLYVEDHAKALRMVLEKGRVGQTYTIGGSQERPNIEVVKAVCEVLDQLKNRTFSNSYKKLIQFVEDRPGHDFRYAIDATKIKRELGWRPCETFETGIKKTVQWYIKNSWWCESASGEKDRGRLGLKKDCI